MRSRTSLAFLSAGALALIVEASTRLAMASTGASPEGAWSEPPVQVPTAVLIGIVAAMGGLGVLLLVRGPAK